MRLNLTKTSDLPEIIFLNFLPLTDKYFWLNSQLILKETMGLNL